MYLYSMKRSRWPICRLSTLTRCQILSTTWSNFRQRWSLRMTCVRLFDRPTRLSYSQRSIEMMSLRFWRKWATFHARLSWVARICAHKLATVILRLKYLGSSKETNGSRRNSWSFRSLTSHRCLLRFAKYKKISTYRAMSRFYMRGNHLRKTCLQFTSRKKTTNFLSAKIRCI